MGFGGATGIAYITVDNGITWRRMDISYLLDEFTEETGSSAFINIRKIYKWGNKLYATALWGIYEIEIF